MAVADRLVHRVGVSLPGLPLRLEGLRIAHLSDLHVSRPRRRYERVAAALDGRVSDLIVLTGDYMSKPGDEDAAMDVLRRLVPRLRARLGVFGVFGNHDSPELRERCGELPVRWLRNECARDADPALEILGLDTDPQATADSVDLVTRWSPRPEASVGGEPPLRVMLAHLPTALTTAGDLGVDLLLCGHTHGGQCRLPGGYPLRNSTDFPLSLTSGILRHQRTLGLVSRGLGEIMLPFRLFCPPHLPIYTLRRGPMTGQATWGIKNLEPW